MNGYIKYIVCVMSQKEGRGNGGMEEFALRGAKWFVHLNQYFTGDKIEKNEMGWTCGAYG